MNVYIFKEDKRENSYYWWTDDFEAGKNYDPPIYRIGGSNDSLEDALINVGRTMIINNIQIDKVFYENKQINKETWDMNKRAEITKDLMETVEKELV